MSMPDERKNLPQFPLDLGTLESVQALFLLLAYRNFGDRTGEHILKKLQSTMPWFSSADEQLVEWGTRRIKEYLVDLAKEKAEFFSPPPARRDGGYDGRREILTQLLWEQEGDSDHLKQAKQALRAQLWRWLISKASGTLQELTRQTGGAKSTNIESIKTTIQYQHLIVEAMRHQVKLDPEPYITTQAQLRVFLPLFDLSIGPLEERVIQSDLVLHRQPEIKVSCAPERLAIRGEGDDANVVLAPAQDEGTSVTVDETSSYVATAGEKDFFRVVFGCDFAEYARGTQPNIKHGCYGIAGERGAGKSSLLRKLRTSLSSQSHDVLTFLVSIPREFDDREFLFAFLYGLCEMASKASAEGEWRQIMLPVVHLMRDLWRRKLWLLVLPFGIYLAYLLKTPYDDIKKHFGDIGQLFTYISDQIIKYRVGLTIWPLILLSVVLVLFLIRMRLGNWLTRKIPEIQRLKLYFSMRRVMAELDDIRRIEEPGGTEFVVPLLPRTTTEVNPMRYSIPLLNQRIMDIIQEVHNVFSHVIVLVDDLDKLTDAQAYEALKNFRAFAALSECLVIISCPYSMYLQFVVFKTIRKDKMESDTVFADMFKLENLNERVKGNDKNGEINKRVRHYIATKLISPMFGKGLLDVLMQVHDPNRTEGGVVLDQDFWTELGEKAFYNRREMVRVFNVVFQNWLGKHAQKNVRSDLESEFENILDKSSGQKRSSFSEMQGYQKKSTLGLWLTAYEHERKPYSKDALQRRIRATEGFKPLEPLIEVLAAKRGDIKGDHELEKLREVLERYLL